MCKRAAGGGAPGAAESPRPGTAGASSGGGRGVGHTWEGGSALALRTRKVGAAAGRPEQRGRGLAGAALTKAPVVLGGPGAGALGRRGVAGAGVREEG